MAILSRSSVRQKGSTKPLPPSKKQPRLHQSHNSTSVTRRKSSPDLLDTTITIESDSDRARQVGRTPNSNSPIPPPTSSIRRPAPASTPATPRHRILEPNYETPSASAALYSQGDRESPDPLDTITPVTAIKRDLEPVSKPSPSVTRSTRPSAATAATAAPAAPAVDNHDVANPAGPEKPRRITRKSSSQPAPAAIDTPPAVGRRSLRSQDVGSRAKCELANYFHNYDELLNLAPVKPEFLAGDTTVCLIDDLTGPLPLPSNPSSSYKSPFGNPIEKLHGCEVIELPKPEEPCDVTEDPLNEGTYFRAHRRIERQEKQLRNIERERAQHEKLQVDRLLEELKGHDWVRVLGLTHISDAEKKLYEPKREFFIKELSLLIEKFNIWRDEEKRRKFGKDKPFVRAGTTPPGAAKATSTGSKQRAKRKRSHSDVTSDDRQVNGASLSDFGDPPDINDVDAWAARQLHQEAKSASSGKHLKPPSETTRKPTKASHTEALPSAPPAPPLPDKPITSFYPDTSVRSKVLSGQSEKPMAFGQLIPDMKERDFDLAPDILTEEAIQASRRKLRRLRRERRDEWEREKT